MAAGKKEEGGTVRGRSNPKKGAGDDTLIRGRDACC
jgi:hypothetical protein